MLGAVAVKVLASVAVIVVSDLIAVAITPLLIEEKEYVVNETIPLAVCARC